MSRPAYPLNAALERIRGQVDRLVEDDRLTRDEVFDALLEVETHCQEWRESLASRTQGEPLDAPEEGE